MVCCKVQPAECCPLPRLRTRQAEGSFPNSRRLLTLLADVGFGFPGATPPAASLPLPCPLLAVGVKYTGIIPRERCQKVQVLVAQSCLTLCDPIDCSLPGFSVHGILQARILEWVAIPFF